MFVPNLKAPLIPGVSAAGFQLGETFSSIQEKIGPVEWYESDGHIFDILLKNKGWIGAKKTLGDGTVVTSFTYMNTVVFLAFEERETLYQIVVEEGYLGDFNGIRLGDDLSLLESHFEIEFDNHEDEFYLLEKGSDVCGISFVTDCRISLEEVPEQKIKYISIYNWDLR